MRDVRAKSDGEILVRATAQLYLKCLREACQGMRKNWYWSFLPVLYLLGNLIIMAILPGGIIAGFILGLYQTFCWSNYLALVACAVKGEKVKGWRYLQRETMEIFLSLINVLFLLFVLSLVQRALAINAPLVVLAINLIIIVCFNPILEVCYQRAGGSVEIFSQALNFVKENTIEWFLPMFLLAIPLIWDRGATLLFQMVSGDPLQSSIIFVTELAMYVAAHRVPSLISFAIFLILLFTFMVFRGLLFKRLSESTRRKRIYQYRFEG